MSPRKKNKVEKLPIDVRYLQEFMLKLLNLHSPTGYTDGIVRTLCEELDALKITYEITRRGAIRANLPGKIKSPDRAIVTHLDTLGAMVKGLKENGRLSIVPVGTWSSRFAEGARVSIFTDKDIFRGTILPLKASGHTYNNEIDNQPNTWENVEIRIDEPIECKKDLLAAGFNIGDFVGVDAQPEILSNGYINSRHLDNKAGVAATLAAAKAMLESGKDLPTDMHLLFTISEETGSGASAVLHGDVAEMVTVDNGTSAPGQASRESGVTVAMADSTGPFDYHLTHHLLGLCRGYDIPHVRDIFKYYRCDSASAVEAGNDIRTSLITFGVDASHGYERTHIDSLRNIAELITVYAQSAPLFYREAEQLTDLEGFPETKTVDMPLTNEPAIEEAEQQAEEDTEKQTTPSVKE